MLHSNEDIGYAFIGPENFEEKEKVIETAVGAIPYTTLYSSNATGDDAGFLFMVSYYPMSIARTDVDTVLTEIVVSGTSSVAGQLQYTEDISLGENPGVLWRISVKDGSEIMKGKTMYDGRHIFIIQVITTPEKALSPRIDAFLDSFRMTSSKID